MNKFFTLVGGRKFVLTIISMLGAAAIDLFAGGLSMPLATFLGAALTAFCASNWLNSKEYYTAEAEKRKGGSVELARLEKKLDKVVKALDSGVDSSAYYSQKLTELEASLGTLMQAQASIMQSTDSTNKLIKAAMQPRS